MADWMRHLEVGEWFDAGQGPMEIVGIDLDGEVVLVQHFDGELEEFEFEAWMALRALPVAPPEDWTNAMGCTYADVDDGVADVPRAGRWDDPLDRLDQTLS